MHFQDILQKYRTEASSKSDLGTKFERLIVRFLKTDPYYAQKLESVCLWIDFFAKDQLGGQDSGIDLVAKTYGGEYWAIQCKFYDEDTQVSKSDVNTFLATSGRTFRDEYGDEKTFSFRLIIATTDSWSSKAIDALRGQAIPSGLLSLGDLDASPVDWSEIYDGNSGKEARKPKHSPRPHQNEAVDKALTHYKNHDRGQMIMACGTGKTFTSLKITELLLSGKKQNCVLFLAPSISLVGQTLREWIANSVEEINPICVCSDPKVSKRYADDDIGETVEDLGMPATTDPEKIVSYYKGYGGMTVIFSTYQSIDQVIEAQNTGLPDFDLAICDEAHRTTGAAKGDKEGYFTKIHNDSNIRVKKRLYMTATSRIYGIKGKEDAKKESVVLYSMDDEEIYGEPFYTINFGDAVSKNLLTDYKVLVLTTTMSDVPSIVKNHWKEDKEIDVDIDCKLWGIINALEKNVAYDETLKHTDPSMMRSAVMFTSSIKKSKYLTKRFNELSDVYYGNLNVKARHVDGSMNALQRDRDLRWLASAEESSCNVLSNVRCLSEGVDVPALDSVIFMSSKNSLVDVVQSVGRVMRRADEKKYGYVIIPVVVPEEEDPEAALDDNEQFKVVWQVLRALRSHDEDIEAEINTFQYRKDNSKGHIHIASPYDGPGSEEVLDILASGQYSLDDFGRALMARLVLKVGDRQYIENWAKKVAEIMPTLIDRLTEICVGDARGYKGAFKRYLKGLKECVNDDVSDKDAINMLAQQVVTKPIFEKLFGGEGFTFENSVSQTIDEMLSEINVKDGLREMEEELQNFYNSVDMTLTKIDTAEGRQKVITSLYEKFFKNAFPKDQAINGVVYTPIAVVDFILRSAADILEAELGMDISSPGVNILDPFTGTGTFIARLMETGIIRKEDLEYKYRNELFANEITLLAYYIAVVNIENTYAKILETDEYARFDNILLTDTFNIKEICERKSEQTYFDEKEVFKKNKERIRREHEAPITVIVGNPPYGGKQKSVSDDAKKRTYTDGIDKRIGETYLDDSLFEGEKKGTNDVYNNYVRAFRWATDRIGNNNGVITFITPNVWLTSGSFEGFRKCIESDFSKIYVFDLRGDQKAGDWRKEGEKIFGDGSMVGIAIMLLVKTKNFNGKAKVYYAKTEDYMKKGEKLDMLATNRSFQNMVESKTIKQLRIKDNGDWIIERNEHFQKLTPLGGDTNKKFEKFEGESVFTGYSRGFGTSRDQWIYNYDKDRLKENIKTLVYEYNALIDSTGNPFGSSVPWDQNLLKDLENRIKLTYDQDKIIKSLYRPFTKQWFYYDEKLIHEVARMSSLFPLISKRENLLICVKGRGGSKAFSCLITDSVIDLNSIGATQCFPLYWYENLSKTRIKNKQPSLFDNSEDFIRHDGISDYALGVAQSKYGSTVSKEDIFFYVYGFLHSPEYREIFSDDLKLSLPRIKFIDEPKIFWEFSKAGRDLAELHLKYEVEPPESLRYKGDVQEMLRNPTLCRTEGMKLDEDERRLVYNGHLTIENIPKEAFEYVVNGRSALGWLVDQYKYTTHTESDIANDPNEYGGGQYILRLVLSVIGMSVKATEIVNSLPKLELYESSGQALLQPLRPLTARNDDRPAIQGDTHIASPVDD